MKSAFSVDSDGRASAPGLPSSLFALTYGGHVAEVVHGAQSRLARTTGLHLGLLALELVSSWGDDRTGCMAWVRVCPLIGYGEPWMINDELWVRIKALVPVHRPGTRGPVPLDDRRCLQGILFVLYVGITWRHLPPELGFGSGVMCWRRFRRWCESGVWQRLHRLLLVELHALGEIGWSAVCLDGSDVRARKGAMEPARHRSAEDDRAPSTMSSAARPGFHWRWLRPGTCPTSRLQLTWSKLSRPLPEGSAAHDAGPARSLPTAATTRPSDSTGSGGWSSKGRIRRGPESVLVVRRVRGLGISSSRARRPVRSTCHHSRTSLQPQPEFILRLPLNLKPVFERRTRPSPCSAPVSPRAATPDRGR